MSASLSSVSVLIRLSIFVEDVLLSNVLELFNLTVILTSEIVANFSVIVVSSDFSKLLASFEFALVSRTVFGRRKDANALIEVIEEGASILFYWISS